MTASAIFVDCRPELAQHLTEPHRTIIPGIEINFAAPSRPEELIELLSGYSAAMVYMAYLSEDVFAGSPDLKCVTYLATGLETHADLKAAKRHGVDVRGVRHYGDTAVAEYAIALLLTACRKVNIADRLVREGEWKLILSREVAGQTCGIVGFGAIGRKTAELARALGMNVLVWNRNPIAPELAFEQVSLPQLMERADAISIHLALTEETRGLIGAELLGKVKRDVVFVNTASAEIVDREALLSALSSGRIGHAALDVLWREPPATDDLFLTMDNVTLSPHTAWCTDAAFASLLKIGFETLSAQIDELSYTK